MIVVVCAIGFYMIDFLLLNIIVNKAIIIDIGYYFKGRLPLLSFSISLAIAVLEELLFRFYFLTYTEGHKVLLLLFGSMAFGIIHIVFSKYDVISKTMLGVCCGLAFIMTNSIFFPIVFHGMYNFLALKEKS